MMGGRGPMPDTNQNASERPYISPKISESLSEYLILPWWVTAKPEEVSLECNLGNIKLQYPFMTARMQSVVGPEMAVAAGRNGILTMVPRSLRDEDKQAILDANNNARLKAGDIEYQSNFVSAQPETRFDNVAKLVETFGYSVIPVIDRFSKLYGVYVHDPNNQPSAPPYTPIKELMLPLRKQGPGRGVQCITHRDDQKIKEIAASEEKKFIPIVNEAGILQEIAFLRKFDTNYAGIAISTRDGRWQEDLEKWGPQVDTLCIDSSNACFDDALKILKAAKERFPDKPFGIGNIVHGAHYRRFAEDGADYVIGGMGVGSICQTGSERGNGRGQMTVAHELAVVRDELEEEGKKVPFVIDGAIETVKDMTIALALADLIMMGNFFNRFYEAAGRKLTEKRSGKNITYIETGDESLISHVETWGEGHPTAGLVAMYGLRFREALAKGSSSNNAEVAERYGHSNLSSSTIEGVVGVTSYAGRLKPGIEKAGRYITTTISNSGGHDLASFRKSVRENQLLERASQRTIEDMLPHGIIVTER